MIAIYIYWILLFTIIYSYIGYALLLSIFVLIKQFGKKTNTTKDQQPEHLPPITLIIAAYNERENVEPKVKNTQSLNYPKNKIQQIWVTDGSTDGTPEVLKSYPEVILVHAPERLGKAMAINHAMNYVNTPITVFSDANTLLQPNSIMELIKPFQNINVGCVSGEKQIIFSKSGSSTGEGVYWKYESFVKGIESETGSTLSAAGELFAIRTKLFQNIETDTILDDFEISTKIAQKGYSVIYAKKAIATEKGSLNFEEERKRKIRIAAGSFQTLFRNGKLLNPFINPWLSFKYISHKVLRWTIVPLAIILLPLVNMIIVINNKSPLYITSLVFIVLFYGMALLGYLFKNNRVRYNVFLLPFYIIMMHISEIQGFIRFIHNKQGVKWEKAKRET